MPVKVPRLCYQQLFGWLGCSNGGGGYWTVGLNVETRYQFVRAARFLWRSVADGAVNARLFCEFLLGARWYKFFNVHSIARCRRLLSVLRNFLRRVVVSLSRSRYFTVVRLPVVRSLSFYRCLLSHRPGAVPSPNCHLFRYVPFFFPRHGQGFFQIENSLLG